MPAGDSLPVSRRTVVSGLLALDVRYLAATGRQARGRAPTLADIAACVG